MKKLLDFRLVIFFIFFIAACENKPTYFIMPNGEKLKSTTVKTFENNNLIIYEDYVGFTMNYNDSILNKFILLEDEKNILSNDVLSKKQIENLKKTNINCLKFNILITDSVRTYDSILKYISNKYKSYEKKANERG